MVNRNPSFTDLLNQLRKNVGRSGPLPKQPALTQIRMERDALALSSTDHFQTAHGPNYFVYPVWNVADLLHWWPIGGPETWYDSGATQLRCLDSIGSKDLDGPGASSAYNTTSEGDVTANLNRRFVKITSSYLKWSNPTTLNGLAAISLGLRGLRVRNLSQTQGLLQRWSSTNSDKAFALQLRTDGSLLFQLAIDSVGGYDEAVTSASLVNPETWYSILLTYDSAVAGAASNRIKLYLDGVSKSLTITGSFNTILRSPATDLEAGRDKIPASPTSISSDFQDIIIWNDDLSSAEASTWHTDARSDRMAANLFRLPGSLSMPIIPAGHSIIPHRVRRRRTNQSGHINRRHITG